MECTFGEFFMALCGECFLLSFHLLHAGFSRTKKRFSKLRLFHFSVSFGPFHLKLNHPYEVIRKYLELLFHILQPLWYRMYFVCFYKLLFSIAYHSNKPTLIKFVSCRFFIISWFII
jgi:hypothetical protein